MILICYPKLSTRSRRAICKDKARWGKPYHYSPRGTLLQRLSRELGMSIQEVYQQLQKERAFLLKNKY
jgi:hypothetical protein